MSQLKFTDKCGVVSFPDLGFGDGLGMRPSVVVRIMNNLQFLHGISAFSDDLHHFVNCSTIKMNLGKDDFLKPTYSSYYPGFPTYRGVQGGYFIPAYCTVHHLEDF